MSQAGGSSKVARPLVIRLSASDNLDLLFVPGALVKASLSILATITGSAAPASFENISTPYTVASLFHIITSLLNSFQLIQLDTTQQSKVSVAVSAFVVIMTVAQDSWSSCVGWWSFLLLGSILCCKKSQ